MEMEMVLSKEELIGKLEHEVRILLHLASKADPAKLDYRPTPRQRSLGELLRYFTVFVPIHLRTIHSGVWDLPVWREAWRKGEAGAAALNLNEIKEAIAKHTELFTQFVSSLTESDLRTNMEMFGQTASRGSWLVWMVLCHYVAYRMQLFQYLKSCGQEELGTLDLWAGVDSTPTAA
jgi:uncharacterized damage-inducible protein DinB